MASVLLHRLLCFVAGVVAKVCAKFSTVDGHSSWENIQVTFKKYETESKVEAGLKAHDFILERIIPDPFRKPIMEFRVRNQERLYSLAEGVANKSLASLMLDYMIPKDDRRPTDVLVLSFNKSQYDELEEKLEEIQRNSDANYNIYINSRCVDDEDEVLQKGTEIPHKENDLRAKNMAGPPENWPRSVLGNVTNMQ